MTRETRHRLSRWLQVATAGAAVVALAGCSTSAPAPTQKTQAIGVVGFSDAVAQSNQVLDAVGKMAATAGWTYLGLKNANPAGDASSANQLMQAFITRGATVLVIGNFDCDQLATGIAAAQAAKVAVLCANNGKNTKGVAWSSDVGYVPDLGDMIKKDYAKSTKVEVLNMTYLPATPGQGRNRMMQDVAKSDSKFVLTDKDVPIPGAVQGGRDFTAAWLSAHPPTPGVDLMIHSVFDQPTEGAVAALRQAGRTDVRIYSYDATPAGLALIKEGYVVGDIWNGGDAGSSQIWQAVQDVVAGKYTAEKPGLDPVAFFIVTPDNIAQFQKDHPDAFAVG